MLAPREMCCRGALFPIQPSSPSRAELRGGSSRGGKAGGGSEGSDFASTSQAWLGSFQQGWEPVLMGLGLFLSWHHPLLIFKMSSRAKTLSELSIAPSLTDCPPASLPSDSGDQSISLCPGRGFWPPPKARCPFISLDGFFSNPLKSA